MIISLIEDEPECFETFGLLLEERGHTVRIYTEADDVVADIQAIGKSDVILLDLMIQLGTMIDPDEGPETGIAIYKRIREISSNIRIVVVTARTKSDVWGHFKNDRFARFIGKPINDLEEFYKIIEEWE